MLKQYYHFLILLLSKNQTYNLDDIEAPKKAGYKFDSWKEEVLENGNTVLTPVYVKAGFDDKTKVIVIIASILVLSVVINIISRRKKRRHE
ncbi:MAG TPA: hypothetical protein GXX66_04600 [Acholeplasmataceae bacterium]|nr:hypothetical protein [Acholeplasmataceae bacterium]